LLFAFPFRFYRLLVIISLSILFLVQLALCVLIGILMKVDKKNNMTEEMIEMKNK
jgi:hypothetical protein